MKSSAWFDLVNRLDGVPLTSVTVGGAGTCVAKMFHGKMSITVTNASAAKMATSTIETPIGFKVVGAKMFKTAGTVETRVAVNNTANDLFSATLGTNWLIERTTTVGTSYQFAAGDDDLVVTMSGTSLGTAIVVLDIIVV